MTRDLPILLQLRKFNAVRVFISVTTLDRELAQRMEPRASLPAQRLRAISELSSAGIPVGLMAAPMIPGLTDHELPAILEAGKNAGALTAGYIVLRLPYGVKDIFSAWLDAKEPDKKQRIISRLTEFRGGKLYDSKWGERMTGKGFFAEQLSQLFEVSARRLGLNSELEPLSVDAFLPSSGKQLSFF